MEGDPLRPAGTSADAGRVRALFRALAALGLAVLLWGLSVQATKSALPASALRTLPPHGTRIADGEVVETADEVVYLAQRHPPGRTFDAGPPVGSVVLEPELTTSEVVVSLVSVLFYWAVAAFVFAARAERPYARDFFACSLAAGAGVAIGGPYPPRGPGEEALLVLYAVAMAFLPVRFLLLSLRFPEDAQGIRPSPWVGRTLTALAVAAAACAAWAWTRHARTLDAWTAVRAANAALLALFAGGLVAGCVVLGYRARRAETSRGRRQATWVLFGVAVGAAPFVLLRTLPRLLGIAEPPIPASFDRVVELAVPTCFAIAVARDRLLDIDLIVRRGVLYTVLGLGAASAFLAVAGLAGERMTRAWGAPREVVWAAAGVASAALFVSARRGVGRWVDRVFFRLRWEREGALAEFREEAERAGSVEEVSARLEAFVQRTLRPSVLAEVIRIDDAWRTSHPLGDALAAAAAEAVETLPVERGDAIPAPSDGRRHGVPEWPSSWSDAGVRLVQPIARGGRVSGLLLLGAKDSGRSYVEEEVELLGAAARHAAAVDERLRFIARVAEEAHARRALADWSRRRTSFLARIAHDLRAPLAAVRWSVQNVCDGIAGPVSAIQSEYLLGVRGSLDQLHRLVESLLELSRREIGAPAPPASAIDLPQVVREVADGLRPLTLAKDVRVEVRCDPVPPVRGRRDALTQVAANLLDNAVKYSPPGATVDVDVGLDPDGAVRLSVRDRGPGVPPDRRAALFEPFRPGPASPYDAREGVGVGLFAVRSALAAIGGTVVLEDPPGGGARFTCRLLPWEEAR